MVGADETTELWRPHGLIVSQSCESSRCEGLVKMSEKAFNLFVNISA